MHQNVVISDINFKRQVIRGYTELTIEPTTPNNKIWKLPLNCKQCRILSVTINSTRKGDFTYVDPTLCICPPDTKKRNLEYYRSCHSDAIWSCDSDASNNGELIIKIPRNTYDLSMILDGNPLKIMIEFSLEQPKGGVQFVCDTSKDTHVFSYGWANSVRLWFPCVDSYTEVCHWSLSFTVPHNMKAISCGDLTEQILSVDGKRNTFHYHISIPTPAPLIAFAIGCFEVYPDPIIPEVTYFCLPGLSSILKNTVQFVHEVFEYYEELLSSGFPHSSYKLVFVNNSYQSVMNYSSLGIFSTELLHSHRIIDNVQMTRRLIAQAIARQYFGCYMLHQSWCDWWLSEGLSLFISGLFIRRMFGSTEYQFYIMEEHNKVCQYEMNNILPPLCGHSTNTKGFHPLLCSEKQTQILSSKSHLVLRMIQLKIGHELLIQVFNKLLTLASVAASSSESIKWSNMLLSTDGFLKLILTVSGKDMTHFADQWISRNGVTLFNCSFNYIRKKNIVELKLIQEPPKGYQKFIGPMSVVIQEFDGCFDHNIQIEETTVTYELPCHSKIRKAKRRKIPLSHGQEIEIDVSSLDVEVPVLWIKIDHEMLWLCVINIQQPDTVWQNTLNYERDAIAQLKSIEALKRFPSLTTQSVLKDAIMNENFYYNVRIKAAAVLSHVLCDLCMSGNGGSPDVLITIYRQLFCVSAYSHANLVKDNDFTNFASYMLQKSLPAHITSVRNSHSHCPREVLSFIMDVIKYSNNESNQYSDGYYRSALIDALCCYVTPPVAVLQPNEADFGRNPLILLQPDVQIVLQEVVKSLNIDKVLPSYKYCVTVSCLKAVRVLQHMGHIPSSSELFKQYSEAGNYIDIRRTSLECIVDIVQVDENESDFVYLLNVIEDNREIPSIRLLILNSLTSKPPFTRRSDSSLNTLALVERLWKVICSEFSSDSRLRIAAVELYNSLYGHLTPTCVPQGLGMVINLKERVARSNVVSPISKDIELEDIVPSPLLSSTHEIDVSTKGSLPDETTSLPDSSQLLKVPRIKLKISSPESREWSPYSLEEDEGKPKHKKHKIDKQQKKKHKRKKHKHKDN